jgi:hypothetical protein
MPSSGKALRIAGWVLSGLLGALFAFSASLKFAAAEEVLKQFDAFGLRDFRLLIGVGEVVSTALFLIPRTGVLGTLLLSGYMGGAIATHMEHGESFLIPSVVLALVWVAAGLRMPELVRRLFWGRA